MIKKEKEMTKKKELEKEIYELLINDYCFYFLNRYNFLLLNKNENDKKDKLLKIKINNFDSNVKYLTWMAKLRDNIINEFLNKQNENTDKLLYFSSTINWIENYAEEIIYLEQIFLKFSQKIPELFELAKNVINSELIVYEISERNPEHTRIISKVFFLCLDSILRIVISKIDELPQDEFFDLIETSREILQYGLQLEANLVMRSKEIFSLQEILKIIDALKLINLDIVEYTKKIIKYFNDEAFYIHEESKDGLNSNLDELYETLKNTMEKLSNEKNFDLNKLLSFILVKEFKKIGYNEYRKNIFDKILNNNDLIKNSSEIIKIIINNVEVDCEYNFIVDNVEYIQDAKTELFTKLNDTQNSFLEEIIMDTFERMISKYFESIPNLESSVLEESYPIFYNQNKDKKESPINKTGIIFDISFTAFQKAIESLDSIQNKNENILRLYCIVYVKMYLNYFSNFIANNYKDMKIDNIKAIIKCIIGIKNNNLSKEIKLYISLIQKLKKKNNEESKKEMENNFSLFQNLLEEEEKNNKKTDINEEAQSSSKNNTQEESATKKYFKYTKYKSIEDMFSNLNNKERYPLINYFVNGNLDIKDLEFLQDFNEFTNYIVNYYSFRITRDSAKTTKLEDAKICDEINFNKKYDKFCKAWNHINSKAIKYRYWPEMIVKDKFFQTNKLINFLNDGEEPNNGMYIAAACQNFIKIQNEFLKSIIDANAKNGIFHNYINTIKKKIPVQDAKYDQIVSIKERLNKRNVDFKDIVNAFSKRNIKFENGKIDYTGYNAFIYDYDAIEEELGNILLPGVCLFEGEDKLNFVTYSEEGFRDGFSCLMKKFYGKYPQKDLSKDDKKSIESFVSLLILKLTGANRRQNYFKNFFDSLELLLFYFTEKETMDGNTKIKDIIEKAPGYLKISDDCKNLFTKEMEYLTINQMMNFWFYIEHLFFYHSQIIPPPKFREEIAQDIKAMIIKNLLKPEVKNDTISTLSLAAATRRIISRYLIGRSTLTDSSQDRELTFELFKAEFWEENIGKLDNLPELVTKKMNDIILADLSKLINKKKKELNLDNLSELENKELNDMKLTVGKAYEFYNIIAGDDWNPYLNEKIQIK